MKYLKFSLITVVSLFLASIFISQTASAQCNVTGATPGGGEIVECNGLDTDGLATTNFPDLVTINPGATVLGFITLNDGDDTINIHGTTDETGSLNADTGNDTINVINGRMFAPGGDCINAANNDDTVTLENAELVCSGSSGINGASGNDIITVSYSEITANNAPVNGASGDDQIIIGDEVLLISLSDQPNIDCGGVGFDTLTFNMAVPEALIGPLTSQLAASDPDLGNITINGFFYEWEACDVLIADFQELDLIRPIPTLSEWGLIAMAGALGIFGMIYMMRRKQVA